MVVRAEGRFARSKERRTKVSWWCVECLGSYHRRSLVPRLRSPSRNSLLLHVVRCGCFLSEGVEGGNWTLLLERNIARTREYCVFSVGGSL